MSELANYLFEVLPHVTKEQVAFFIGSLVVIDRLSAFEKRYRHNNDPEPNNDSD